MTTPAVTGLSIDIADDGAVILRAADRTAEGHLWAIEPRPITLDQLRQIAAILGADAQQGVEARLMAVRDKLRWVADRAQARVDAAAAAREALHAFDEAVGKSV